MWAAGHDASTGVDDVDAPIKTLIERGAALDLKDDRVARPQPTSPEPCFTRAAKLWADKAGGLPSPTGEGWG